MTFYCRNAQCATVAIQLVSRSTYNAYYGRRTHCMAAVVYSALHEKGSNITALNFKYDVAIAQQNA